MPALSATHVTKIGSVYIFGTFGQSSFYRYDSVSDAQAAGIIHPHNALLYIGNGGGVWQRTAAGATVVAFDPTDGANWTNTTADSPLLDPDDIAVYNQAETDIPLGALRKLPTTNPVTILARIVDDATADATIAPTVKWQDVTALDPNVLNTIDSDAAGGTSFALFGSPARFKVTGATPVTVLFPSDGGINANLRAMVFNQGTSTVTVEGVVIPAGGGVVVTADGGIDGPFVTLMGGSDVTETALATLKGLQVVGEYGDGTYQQVDAATLPTEIDFNVCDIIELEIADTSEQHRTIVRMSASIVPGVTNGGLAHWHDTVYIRASFADEAAKAAGNIRLEDINSNALTIAKIRGLAYAANGLVVPTGTTVRDTVVITANAGAVTVLGGAQAFTGTPNGVSLEVPAGQVIESITADSGATVTIENRSAGLVNVNVPPNATGTIDLTVTFVAGSTEPKLHDWAYLPSNGGEHVFAILPQLKFKASSAHRQLTAQATGADVIVNDIWSRWEQSSENTAQLASRTFAENGPDQNFAATDFNFSQGGAGETTYCVIDGKKVRVTMWVDHSWVNSMVEIWVEQ